MSWKGYINCINVKEYLDFRMPLSRVLVAALAVQVPDRTLRAQGQSLKQKMCYGKTCYTVQSADRLVPVRQMWRVLKLIPVWKKNIETTLFIRLVTVLDYVGLLVQLLWMYVHFTEVRENLHSIKIMFPYFYFYVTCDLAS